MSRDDAQNRILIFESPLIAHPNLGKFKSKDVNIHDFVKVIFIEKDKIPELLWVLVLEKMEDGCVGILDNEPYNLTFVRFKDIIKFPYEHIAEICRYGNP